MGTCYSSFNIFRKSIQELFIKFDFLTTNTRNNKSSNTIRTK